MKKCPECASYNKGAGTRRCLKCNKYKQILIKSVARDAIQTYTVPQNILEAVAEELDPKTLEIVSAIRTLPPQHAAITTLIYFAGLTYRQVASILKISVSTVNKKNKFSLNIIKKTIE